MPPALGGAGIPAPPDDDEDSLQPVVTSAASAINSSGLIQLRTDVHDCLFFIVLTFSSRGLAKGLEHLKRR
jgi:hypothetical protein